MAADPTRPDPAGSPPERPGSPARAPAGEPARRPGRSCAWRSPRSARWSPSRCSRSSTQPSSARWARPPWRRSAPGAQVFTTVTGLAIFLAYGTTAVVARRVGAGQLGAAISDGVEGVALASGWASLATVAPGRWRPQLLDWIGTSPATTPEALTYLRTISLAFPFALVAMAAIGVLRGLQDTATTLWVTSSAVLHEPGAGRLPGAGRPAGGSPDPPGPPSPPRRWPPACSCAILARRARQHGAPLRPEPVGGAGRGPGIGPALLAHCGPARRSSCSPSLSPPASGTPSSRPTT